MESPEPQTLDSSDNADDSLPPAEDSRRPAEETGTGTTTAAVKRVRSTKNSSTDDASTPDEGLDLNPS